MEQEKKHFYTNKKFWYGVLIFLVVGTIVDQLHPSTAPQPVAVETPQAPVVSFDKLAKARFADIQTTMPELDKIECADNVCDNLVYFTFKTIPDDYQTIIRGNSATYSKFFMDKTGRSNITIVARVGTAQFFTCNASDGRVTDCKQLVK